MLYSYIYVSHRIEKMQKYIDFIFEVWRKAPKKNYDITLFNDCIELKEIIQKLKNTKNAKFFIKGIEKIFLRFKELSAYKINKLYQWFKLNNNIKTLCNNIKLKPVNYDQISKLDMEVSALLKDFFTKLYSQSFLKLAPIKNKIGIIEEHYNYFIVENNKIKCPYCGLNDIKGDYYSKREAYDHFMPKSDYPFNSINFRNLAPMCHECNSSYKFTKDPLYLKVENGRRTRRTAFYAYEKKQHKINIKISLQTKDFQNLKPEDMSFKFGPKKNCKKINTWLEVFGILERYKAKCCQETDGRYWVAQISDECLNYEKSSQEILEFKFKDAKRNPFSDNNFLKKPFLEACKNNKIFDN